MGKTFRTAVAKEKISFTIEGGDGDEYDYYREDFVCRGAIPAGIIMEFGELSSNLSENANASGADAQALAMQQGAKLLSIVKEFFSAALARKDRDRFSALLKDPEKPVPMETLMQIMNYLSAEFSARPTGEPSSNSSPAMSTGADSTDGLLPAGTIFSRPEPTQAAASA